MNGLINDTALRYLLAAAVLLPLLGSAAALLPAPPGLRGRGPEQAVLRHGVTVTGAVLLLSLLLAAGFDRDRPQAVQAETDVPWIPALDVRLHLGVDGISLPLTVLTALLFFLCALHTYVRRPAGGTARAFTALLLLLEAGTLATFTALDLLLFFLAFETVLIPMYFLIARWGGSEGAAGGASTSGRGREADGRRAAAWKFILFTLLGSVVMLLGLLLVGLRGGTFDMVALAADNGSSLGHATQAAAALAIGTGLAVKTPMWPLHSWLPAAHTAAPTVGSVLLAGVLLKMGTYGFVRIVLPVVPDGARTLAPALGAFAVAGIVYGSLACLALARAGAGGDLKRLVAYSSVGHMGFVLLGIATLTPTGVNGALFANVAHGLITGLLFFLVGAVKDRYGTTDLDRLAGDRGAALYAAAPRLGGLLAFGAVASLGLPGLAGFWGEMLAMFGAFRPADGLSRPAYLAFTAVAGFGTLLTAAYLLVVVRRVCMGERPLPLPPAPPAAPPPAAAGAPPAAGAAAAGTAAPARAAAPPREPAPASPPADVRLHELATWSPLVALTVLAGLWPAVLLALTDPAVQHLLGGSR